MYKKPKNVEHCIFLSRKLDLFSTFLKKKYKIYLPDFLYNIIVIILTSRLDYG